MLSATPHIKTVFSLHFRLKIQSVFFLICIRFP